jgi:hypothetical protein
MIDLQRSGHFKIADDLSLAARITNKLEKHYPGYLWGVLFDEDGGVVNIINETVQSPLATNLKYGYVLHMRTIHMDPDLKCVMRAGGEILERARLDRTRAINGEVPKFVDGIPDKHQPLLDHNGNPIIR